MDMNQFIDRTLEKAKQAGIQAAEVYYANEDSFSAMCVKGDITNYSVNSTGGLSLRGLSNGKMGYASTEAFDEEAIARLVQGVLESAALIEDPAVQEIFSGSEHYAAVDTAAHFDQATEADKLAFLHALEKAALNIDPRVEQLTDVVLQTSSVTKTIKNTFGLNLTHSEHYVVADVGALAKDEKQTASEDALRFRFRMDELNAQEIAKEAVEKTLFMLKAKPVKSGRYRAIFAPSAMMDMLSTFSGVFSSENAQQGLSLLNGREGEKIAAECVTLCDNPLYKDGFASCPFDAEGVATYTKNVVENGVLNTLLYNLKTAKKAGKKTTGNASKGGYSGAVRVSASNFFLVPGQKTQDEMLEDLANGLVITDVTGLHAGANAISGDFSLSAKGYTVTDGKKDAPVNQITVAGNFYELLKQIRAVGADLTFVGPIGSPSVDVGEISVAGE